MVNEDLTLILIFITGISFIIFMNLQGYYIMRLNSLLKRKYPSLHKKLIFVDFGYAAVIPRPIRLMKYIWFEKSYPSDIYILIKKICLFQKLGILFLILAGFSPAIVELFF